MNIEFSLKLTPDLSEDVVLSKYVKPMTLHYPNNIQEICNYGFTEILNTQSWIDPNGAAALQRIRLRLGQRKWQRSYRFTQQGVFRLEKIPKDSREKKLPLDQ